MVNIMSDKKLVFFALVLVITVFSCKRSSNTAQNAENDSGIENSISLSNNSLREALDADNNPEQYDDEDDFTFTVIPDDWGEPWAVSIDGYKGSQKEIHIPRQIQNLPVIKIGENAFADRQLTSVIIPDSVYIIEAGAFKGNRLADIIIPGNVWEIGESAFEGNLLTGVTLNNSIKEIKRRTFANNKLTALTIPDIVTDIKEMAFADNQLAEIIIPSRFYLSDDSFPYGFSAFFNSNKAKPGTYTRNGASWSVVFSEYDDPKDFDIKIIDEGESVSITRYKERNTATLRIPTRIRGLPVTGVGEQAFFGNHLLSVTIPDSVTNIGIEAFSHNALTNVIIPDSVTHIGHAAFSNNDLTSVIIPDSVTYIGNWAFQDNRLTSVIIGSNVSSIGGLAFLQRGRIRIQSITIPGNVDLTVSQYNVFGYGFDEFYNSNGKKAGTYTWDGKSWSVQYSNTLEVGK